MINKQLLDPKSIAVIGGSNDITKPGGKVLKNLSEGSFQGEIHVLNPKEAEVQGFKCYHTVEEMPKSDLAIIAIAAKHIIETVSTLIEKCNTKAFIVLSAGFGEESEAGKKAELQLVEIIDKANGCLIGPNCVGIITPAHQSVFTKPIPKLDPHGCDFISGSGATACFIMEAGIPKGLTFANMFSVGNSAQTSVEDILKYMDENFDPKESSAVKILYMEDISKPKLLLKHASSLIRKGCKIAAIKAGASDAGSRAASSHTGAMASSDVAVDALFKKAGIIRCYGREDLINTASVFMHKELSGKNIAVITHAGGPAVMLTDALAKGGLEIPEIKGKAADELLTKLFPGSSVANPIDFLATGTAEQLEIIIDYVENHFDHIDAMVVIFGTPGLFKIFDVYEVLHKKMNTCSKPIFPVLPSTLTAKAEVEDFLAKGHINFPDEVYLGNALSRVYNRPKPQVAEKNNRNINIDKKTIREIVEHAEDGYLPANKVSQILNACNIAHVKEFIIKQAHEIETIIEQIGFPLVMKVVGPVHKSDTGGVVLNIDTLNKAQDKFQEIMKIPGAEAVMIQPMLQGKELFIGAKREDKFGHLILCGMGGTFIEILKDTQVCLAPVSKDEALEMIHKLRSYKILKGYRGEKGINIEDFASQIVNISLLLEAAPEIFEMDINPFLASENQTIAVDTRIRIVK